MDKPLPSLWQMVEAGHVDISSNLEPEDIRQALQQRSDDPVRETLTSC
ncbi:MAG: hypothetical protein R3F04_16385 [Lysobacteraceae bacterium]